MRVSLVLDSPFRHLLIFCKITHIQLFLLLQRNRIERRHSCLEPTSQPIFRDFFNGNPCKPRDFAQAARFVRRQRQKRVGLASDASRWNFATNYWRRNWTESSLPIYASLCTYWGGSTWMVEPRRG